MENIIVITMYGKDDTVSSFSVSSYPDQKQAERYCRIINLLRLENTDWIHAQIIEENLKINLTKPKLATMDCVVQLSDRDMQMCLRELDSNTVQCALKGTTSEVQRKVFQNMSKRAASMLREDMDFMGPIGLDQSEKYQKDFLQVIQKLMSTGQIYGVKDIELLP